MNRRAETAFTMLRKRWPWLAALAPLLLLAGDNLLGDALSRKVVQEALGNAVKPVVFESEARIISRIEALAAKPCPEPRRWRPR